MNGQGEKVHLLLDTKWKPMYEIIKHDQDLIINRIFSLHKKWDHNHKNGPT